MKRIVVLPLAFLLCCCAGCSKEPPTVGDSFTLSLRTQYNGLDVCGTLTRSTEGLQLNLTEPYTVAGMRFDYADEQLCIDCDDLQTRAASDHLPASALPARLYTALLYLPQAEYQGSDDGTDTFLLPASDGDAVLRARDGIPLSLILPKDQTEIVFLDR